MESRNEYYMRRALYEAGKAMDNDEVPQYSKILKPLKYLSYFWKNYSFL